MFTQFSTMERTSKISQLPLRTIILISSFLSTVYLPLANSLSQEQLKSMKLRLYLGENSTDNYVDANIEEAEKLIGDMDLEKPTVIYIHGFSENIDSESVYTIVNAHLKNGNKNVVLVDYSEIASENYILVALHAPEVGRAVGKAIDELVGLGLNAKGVHVVGHSLGAQVAGYVGRNVSFKLSRITGLDPAGPMFYIVVDHLTSVDAEFVLIIHTDAGFYGNAMTSGKGADFYVNGGTRVQPGCPLLSIPYSDEDFCSHHRSWYYYAESVANAGAFVGVRCDHWWTFKSNNCKNNKKVLMGDETPSSTKGSFYLETKGTSPFGRGKDGVHPTADFW